MTPEPKRLESERVELVWWGRLHQHTKRVHDLVAVAEDLQALGVDFRLRIVGPDSGDTTAESMQVMIDERNLADHVSLTGPLHGDALTNVLTEAHVYISTSAIEGYPLSLIEAQSLGLPVVMYDLPWLAALERNEGVTIVEQGDAWSLAARTAELLQDRELYLRMSKASIEAARRAIAPDFVSLYGDLLGGNLGSQYSPLPTIEDAQVLLDLAVKYNESGVRISKRRDQRQHARIRELSGRVIRLMRRVRLEDEARNASLRSMITRRLQTIQNRVLKFGRS